MKRIILDTDVGTDVDDALAIALAAAPPELEIMGVTTVHGDAPVRARIARRLLQLAGRDDVHVVAGASLPLGRPLPRTFHWNPTLWGHEGRGLLPPEDLTPTEDLAATEDDAARFIVEMATAHRGELSLVTIGPLTNIARALRLEPRLRDWIGDVTAMGGMVDAQRVHWPPVLETNLNADPVAAQVVLASGMPLTLAPFEVTTQVYLTPEHRAAMRGWGSPLSSALVDLMEEMLRGFTDFSERMALPANIFEGQRTYMHDPLAVYTSMATHHVRLRRLRIQAEVHDDVLRTMPYPDGPPNAWVCTDVNADALVALWLERIKGIGPGSKPGA